MYTFFSKNNVFHVCFLYSPPSLFPILLLLTIFFLSGENEKKNKQKQFLKWLRQHNEQKPLGGALVKISGGSASLSTLFTFAPRLVSLRPLWHWKLFPCFPNDSSRQTPSLPLEPQPHSSHYFSHDSSFPKVSPLTSHTSLCFADQFQGSFSAPSSSSDVFQLDPLDLWGVWVRWTQNAFVSLYCQFKTNSSEVVINVMISGRKFKPLSPQALLSIAEKEMKPLWWLWKLGIAALPWWFITK